MLLASASFALMNAFAASLARDGFPGTPAAVARLGMGAGMAAPGLGRDLSGNGARAVTRVRIGPASASKDSAARGRKLSGAARAVAG